MTKTVNEFKAYGKQYIQYKALIKAPKHTKQQSLYIWKWDEDIHLKSSMERQCERLFSSCKIPFDNRRSQLQMDIIKVNKVLWHAYGPPPKGTFDNKEINNLVGESCKKVSLKETAKAWLTAAVAVEAFAQVEDDVINNEEGELDEQYVAIGIDYETKLIGGGVI